MLAEKGGVTFPYSFGIMVLHGKNMYLNDVFHGFYELKPCRNRHREIGSLILAIPMYIQEDVKKTRVNS